MGARIFRAGRISVPVVVMAFVVLAGGLGWRAKGSAAAQQRACWVNQKTLAGAMEMYALDN